MVIYLISGKAGVGKSFLARNLTGVLPRFDHELVLEIYENIGTKTIAITGVGNIKKERFLKVKEVFLKNAKEKLVFIEVKPLHLGY